jgi:membrane-bound lytic murein transglycosylase D
LGLAFLWPAEFLGAADGEGAAVVAETAVQAPALSASPLARPVRQQEYAKPAFFTSAPVSSLVLPAMISGGLDQELTRYYIKQYSSPSGIARLNGIIRQGSPYIPFIRGEISKRGLPPELLYLPVIESGYNPRAISKSGAAGLWQFMKNSMGPFDMTVTDMMDERMDFWKSTQGALSKLEENYRYLGDWALALAAYNTGLGGVNRVINRTGIRDYWALCDKKELRTETVHYVPKFIAAAYILSNPRRFGIDFWPDAPEWTRIPAGKMVDLGLLAELAGLEPGILETANPELYHRISPSADGSYQLKVPVEAAASVAEVLAREDLKLIKHYIYTIQSGDTLSVLARHYGITTELIQETNPGLRPQALRIGQEIRIPALKEAAPYQKTKNADRPFEGNHLVKRGETLWSIALAYEVDPEELAGANGMALNDTLREGRVLKTPILKE